MSRLFQSSLQRLVPSPRRQVLSMLVCLGVLLFGLALTSVGASWLTRDATQEGRLRFERYADKLELDVSARFVRVLNAFKGMRGYFNASPMRVTRDDFRIWVASRRIYEDMPGIRGIGFIQRVDRPQLGQFLEQERADNAPGFQIRTEGQASDLYVIKYIEPLANNERAWGYDIGSEAIRRAAAERAVDTGQPALTRRIVLVQDGKRRPGYLYFLPVFRWASKIDTPLDRRRNLIGLIYAPIVMDEFLARVGEVADQQLDMQLFDGDSTQASQQVFDLGTQGGVYASRFQSIKRLEIGGHTLLLRAHSTPEFDSRFEGLGVWWFSLAGTLLSLLLSATIWLLMAGRARAEAIAQHMTADLSAAKQRAEAALRESSALLDTLHRFSLVSVTDRHGTIIDVNDAFCAISGYSRAELIGHSHRLINSGRHSEGFWRHMWHQITQGEPWAGEVCNRSKDGSLYWVKSIVVPLMGAEGLVERYVSIRTDISDNKRYEQELHNMAERYQLAIDGGSDGLWDWLNVNDHKMWWSPQLYRLLGYEPDVFPASLDAFEGLLHADNRKQVLATFELALKQVGPLDVMCRLKACSGEYRWFRCRGKVFFDESGFATRMAGSMQDVHDRWVAEETIKSHSEQLGAIFALSPDGFVSFGADGRVSYVSAAFSNLVGLPTQQMLGLDERSFLAQLLQQAVNPPEAPTLAALMLAPSTQDPVSWRARHRLVLELKSPPGRMLALSLQEAKGEAVASLLLLRDVTQEAEGDRAKSAFLSMAAHELRTPMSSIYGFVELLLTRELKAEKQKDLLSRVYRQCEVMIAIINELLDLARIESRRGADFDSRIFDLVSVVDEVVVDFKLPQGRLAPKVLRPDHAVPVFVDHHKMCQAFLNVLSNAYKYSPGGGEVTVSFPVRPDAGGLRWVGVCVEDHGIGMSPEQLAHMGERFFRADKSGNIPGTGLGVSIVMQIMELMDGHVEIHSELGQGTRMTLWLPMVTHALPIALPA